MPILDPAPIALTNDPLHKRLFYVTLPDAGFGYEYIKEIPDLPGYQLQTVEQRQQFDYANYVSGTRLQDLSIVFYEDHVGTVGTYFYQWLRLVFNPETGICGLPGKYKKIMQIDVLQYDGTTAARNYQYTAFPTSITGYNMSTAEGLVTPTIRFKVEFLNFDTHSSSN